MELGLLPGQNAQRGTVHFHHADQLRVVGHGHLGMTVYSLDGNKTIIPAKSPLSLLTNPGLEPLLRYSMMSEHVSPQFTNNNELDSWFQLSKVSHFYSLGPLQR